MSTANRPLSFSIGATVFSFLLFGCAGTEVTVGVYPKADHRIGETFKDCPECPEMVVIPAGRFRMGDQSDSGYADQTPVHAVSIGSMFAVGKFEVTFDEWGACVAAGGCGGYRPKDQGWGRGNRPVISVSWDDAKAYVDWLSRQTGNQYRLLSEAEWEYAARAGTPTRFSTGWTITTDQANFDGKGFGGSAGLEKTFPVGSFPANAFGLYDLHGNVWEWVEDCWHGNYQGAPSDGSTWTRAGNCEWRVVRGGSWRSYFFQTFHSASRGSLSPAYRDGSDGGFRVAMDL